MVLTCCLLVIGVTEEVGAVGKHQDAWQSVIQVSHYLISTCQYMHSMKAMVKRNC